MRPSTRIVVLCLFVSACVVPDRDNPFDPRAGQYPQANLQVRVRNGAQETIGISGSRTTTFVFDATGSTSATGKALRYAWEVDDARWDAGDPNDFDTVGNDGSNRLVIQLPLTAAMLEAGGVTDGIGEAVRDVKLRVTEGVDGPAVIATASVILKNEAPEILAQSEDWFISPTNVPTRVVLDACGMVGAGGPCRVADRDSDLLSFEWRQIAGTTVALALSSNGRYASFAPATPIDPRGYAFEFDATDGLAVRTDTVTVHSASALWYSTQTPARLYRVFPEFRVLSSFRRTPDLALTPFGNSGIGAGGGAAVDPGTGEYWTSDVSNTYRLSRAFTEQRRWGVGAVSIAPDGSRACAAGFVSPTETGIFALRANGTFVRVAASAGFFGVNDRVVSAGPGACWTLHELANGNMQLGKLLLATESYTMIATNLPPPINAGSYETRQLMIPTADGGAWLALGGYGDPDCSGICRVPPTATSFADLDSADNGYAGADVVALDPDGVSVLWHKYGGSEWFRVVPGVEFSVPVVGMPQTFWTYTNVTDVLGKALWVTDQAGYVHRCVGSAGVFRDCRKLSAADASELEVPQFKELALDPLTGGVLMSIAGYSNETRVATVAPHLRRRDTLENPVSSTGHTLAADPATGAVHYADGYFVGSVSYHKYSSGGAVLSSGFQFTEGVEAFRPERIEALADGGAWVFGKSLQGLETVLARFDAFGVEQQRIELATRDVAEFGASPDGATLCLAIAGEPAFGIDQELMRFAGGTLTSLGTLRYNNDNGRQRAVTTPAGGCWFAGTVGATVRFFHFAAGSVVPSATVNETNSVDSWKIQSDPRDGTLWAASGLQGGVSSSDKMLRISTTGVYMESYVNDFNPGGTLSWSIFDFALRRVCPSAADPNCLEVWQLTSTNSNELIRSDGRIDKPLERRSAIGVPNGISLAP